MGYNYLKKVHYCTLPDCHCGIRCPKCDTNFVKNLGNICENCAADAYCDNCGQLQIRLYKKWTKLPLPFQFKYDPDQCSRCGVIGKTNVYHYCASCHSRINTTREALICDDCYHKVPNVCSKCKEESDVLVEGKMCPDCYYGQGWEEMPDMRTRDCIVCHNRTYVDENGFCRSCYINSMEMSQGSGKIHRCMLCSKWTPKERTYCTSCQQKATVCAECEDWFVPTHSGQMLCVKCLPDCKGCGTKFSPLNRTDLYCSNCIALIARGQCLKCHRPDIHGMDKNGHCHDCSTIQDDYSGSFSMGYPCVRCGTNQVEDPREICNECKQKEYLCPRCKTNKISYKDYTCDSCANNYKSSV